MNENEKKCVVRKRRKERATGWRERRRGMRRERGTGGGWERERSVGRPEYQ
jgi:hypothetical protein